MCRGLVTVQFKGPVSSASAAFRSFARKRSAPNTHALPQLPGHLSAPLEPCLRLCQFCNQAAKRRASIMCERARSFFLGRVILAPLAVLGKSNDGNNDRDEEFRYFSWRCPLETNQSSFDLPAAALGALLCQEEPALKSGECTVGVCAPAGFRRDPISYKIQKAHQRTFDDCASHRHHPGDPSTKSR